MKQGLIVLGASGSLASDVISSVRHRFDELYLFDKCAKNDVIKCDLSSNQEVDCKVQNIPLERANKWCLLSCVGIYDGAGSSDNHFNAVENSICVNLTGVIRFSLQVIDSIRNSGAFMRMVIVTSAASRVGSRDIGYGVSKAGLEGFVRSVSKSYAHAGVTAIGVAPGLFPSQMSMNQTDQRKSQAMLNHIQRATAIAEVANCIEFAMLNAPDALTSTILHPNGGQVSP
ncbi:MAG: SDR family oxidoreductase [Cyanobacteria bacterium P01_H01_bin.15]